MSYILHEDDPIPVGTVVQARDSIRVFAVRRDKGWIRIADGIGTTRWMGSIEDQDEFARKYYVPIKVIDWDELECED